MKIESLIPQATLDLPHLQDLAAFFKKHGEVPDLDTDVLVWLIFRQEQAGGSREQMIKSLKSICDFIDAPLAKRVGT